jgi:ketosteroid isomerase-like protein
MSAVIDAAWARAFAQEWCDAWNARDLPRVLSHYRDDFEMASPLIVERGLDPGGVLRGKPAVAAYWGRGIASAQPPLRFELIDAYAGVDRVVIHYRSVGRRLVMEVLTFDAERRVVRASACWGPAA